MEQNKAFLATLSRTQQAERAACAPTSRGPNAWSRPSTPLAHPTPGKPDRRTAEMARLSQEQRHHNEAAIRAAMDRLLRGEIPPGGGCDIRTLAVAGVTRTGFYAKGDRPGPHQHLTEEFERRLAALQQAGQIPDPHADRSPG